MVAARKQIQTLKPARDEHMELGRGNSKRNGLRAIRPPLTSTGSFVARLSSMSGLRNWKWTRRASRQEVQQYPRLPTPVRRS